MATDLLLKQRLAVQAQGDRVVLSIGNTDVGFDYETALQLSQWMRVRAKEAKKNAGDMSRHWSAIGMIEGLR